MDRVVAKHLPTAGSVGTSSQRRDLVKAASVLPGVLGEAALQSAFPPCILPPETRGAGRRWWPAQGAPSPANRLHKFRSRSRAHPHLLAVPCFAGFRAAEVMLPGGWEPQGGHS